MGSEGTWCLPVLLHRLLFGPSPGNAGIHQGVGTGLECAAHGQYQSQGKSSAERAVGYGPGAALPVAEKKAATMSGSAVMSRASRWLIALSASMLAAVFVLPVWRISLLAPQYPEGLGMLIRINTITGMKPADLNNINGLNHYIGMKTIVPEAIPVLHVMPIALAVLVLLGLIVALYGRRWAAW